MKLPPAALRGNPSLASILVIFALLVGFCSVQCLPSSPEALAVAASAKDPLVAGGPESVGLPKGAGDDSSKAGGVASAPMEAKPAVASAKQESEQEAQARKGRSEPPPAAAAAASNSSPTIESKKSDTPTTEKPAVSDKPSNESKPPAASKSAQEQQKKQAGSSSSSGAKSQLAAKSSPSNKKQPSNLGTVTSTGSGGAAHYMSKHDAYSAIAEKHGALAQDAMRKSDKRHLQRFGGIQKASGNLGDMLSPFKGVTDSGLARTLGASMRSIMKSKYSVPAYVASALLGAVALMAFYESPMSPLPVPALPEPPVGRFPPEMPSLPPGIQVPFRGSQQFQQLQQSAYGNQAAYGSNQRSFQAPAFSNIGASSSNQQQQVLFPGNTANAAAAQQRQSGSPGPVQQLAANLLSSVGGKQQNAQRKSGPDQADPSPASSRSLFGASGGGSSGLPLFSPFNTGKLSAPLNSNNHHQQPKPGASSFLSYFGLGGLGQSSDLQQASSGSGAQYLIGSASGLLEPKGQSASGLSNSHVVNKVKSYFNMRPSSSSQSASTPSGSSSSSSSSANPYDEYQRMSFVQALMKDTAFLPAFLVPSRKSTSSSASQAPPSSSSSSSSSSSASTSPSSGSSASVQPAAARMQVDSQSILPLVGSANQQQQQYLQPQPSQSAPAKRGSSSFGLGRIAHALLDTFTSGIMQRSAPTVSLVGDRKSSEPMQQSPLVSATSLLTDIMSSYNSQQLTGQQNSNNMPEHLSPSQQQQVDLANKQQQVQNQQQQYQGYHHQQQQTVQQAPNAAGSDSAMSRSLDGVEIGSASETGESQKLAGKQTVSSPALAAETSSNSQSSSSPLVAASQTSATQHVRKTRSIGLEYPIESNQALARRQEQPSRAAQINNLVDYVSDSYTQNRLLFNFVMNQVGLSHAVPYVEQILVPGKESPAQLQ